MTCCWNTSGKFFVLFFLLIFLMLSVFYYFHVCLIAGMNKALQRKVITLLQCQVFVEEGRSRALRAARYFSVDWNISSRKKFGSNQRKIGCNNEQQASAFLTRFLTVSFIQVTFGTRRGRADSAASESTAADESFMVSGQKSRLSVPWTGDAGGGFKTGLIGSRKWRGFESKGSGHVHRAEAESSVPSSFQNQRWSRCAAALSSVLFQGKPLMNSFQRKLFWSKKFHKLYVFVKLTN